MQQRPHLGEQSRTLTISADVVDHDSLRIRVKDDGDGIAPENITRIFAHGFTTRKEGHGFGLHSCALAAMEMNGTLTVHSDGLGKGAVFTLRVPFQTAPDVQGLDARPELVDSLVH
jgi:two-component system NtrC family sensor kinase